MSEPNWVRCECPACDMIGFVVFEIDSRPRECVVRDGFKFHMKKANWDKDELTCDIVKKALTNMENPNYYFTDVKIKFTNDVYVISLKVNPK